MSILKVPGAQLFYEVNGSGPLLILIPGRAAQERASARSHTISSHITGS